MSDKASQVAAMPLRRRKNGKLEVLLVTSRQSGRWVLPKGWPMPGKAPWRAAQIEALEEAGVTGPVAHDDVGRYRYGKRLDDGRVLTCRVKVFPMLVEDQRKSWKERSQRQRRWFTLGDAAQVVDEGELREMLRALGRAPKKQRAVRNLLKAG